MNETCDLCGPAVRAVYQPRDHLALAGDEVRMPRPGRLAHAHPFSASSGSRKRSRRCSHAARIATICPGSKVRAAGPVSHIRPLAGPGRASSRRPRALLTRTYVPAYELEPMPAGQSGRSLLLVAHPRRRKARQNSMTAILPDPRSAGLAARSAPDGRPQGDRSYPGGVEPMYARIIRAHVPLENFDQALAAARDYNLPMVTQMPGFRSGYWTGDRQSGTITSFVVFDSQDGIRAAEAGMERMRPLVGRSTSSSTRSKTWKSSPRKLPPKRPSRPGTRRPRSAAVRGVHRHVQATLDDDREYVPHGHGQCPIDLGRHDGPGDGLQGRKGPSWAMNDGSDAVRRSCRPRTDA
jgi:hypothetical protein